MLTLVEQLPEGSSYVAALAGGPQWRGWDTTRYLLADIFDAVQHNTVGAFVAAGAKNVKPPAPWPRPGLKQSASPEQGRSIREVMAEIKAQLGTT